MVNRELLKCRSSCAAPVWPSPENCTSTATVSPGPPELESISHVPADAAPPRRSIAEGQANRRRLPTLHESACALRQRRLRSLASRNAYSEPYAAEPRAWTPAALLDTLPQHRAVLVVSLERFPCPSQAIQSASVPAWGQIGILREFYSGPCRSNGTSAPSSSPYAHYGAKFDQSALRQGAIRRAGLRSTSSCLANKPLGWSASYWLVPTRLQPTIQH